MLTYASICDGIGAAHAAWVPLGYRPLWVAETAAFPSSVTAHHLPGVQNHGDLLTLHQRADLADPDVLVAGTPCQSFSVAGLRGGLSDPRGNLALAYVALAGLLRPRWIVWENVPGVLSADGGDAFRCLVRGLVEVGYGVAWRVLDAQWFGVPQRRERVFVVGHSGGDFRCAAAVLFEPEGVRRDSPPRRETGARVAACLDGSAGDGGADDNDARGYRLIAAGPDVSPAIKARDHKGPSSDGDGDGAPLIVVAHTLRAEGHDASEDGTGRGVPLVPIAFDTTQITSAANRSCPQVGDPCHPLAAHAHAPAIAFSVKDHGADAAEELSPTLRAGGHADSHANGGVMPAVVEAYTGDGVTADPISANEANTYSHEGSANFRMHNVVRQTQRRGVRRLLPIECERLQGFPDGHTAVPVRGKPAADGPRYKALGNSMAVPCMAWIGRRILLVDAIPEDDK